MQEVVKSEARADQAFQLVGGELIKITIVHAWMRWASSGMPPFLQPGRDSLEKSNFSMANCSAHFAYFPSVRSTVLLWSDRAAGS